MPRRAVHLAAGPAAAACLVLATIGGLPPIVRAPLFVVAALWAPGDLLLRALGRAMHPIERVACAVALGLFLLPVVGLALSTLHALRGDWIGAAYLAIDGGLALVAFGRTAAPPRSVPPHRLAPSAPVTFALSGGALLVAGAVFALPLVAEEEGAPLALGLVGPDGTTESLPHVIAEGDTPLVRAVVIAGDTPRDGALVAAIRSPGGTVEATATRVDLALDAGARREVDIPLPPLTEGEHVLSVAWRGDEAREVHLTLYVERAPE